MPPRKKVEEAPVEADVVAEEGVLIYSPPHGYYDFKGSVEIDTGVAVEAKGVPVFMLSEELAKVGCAVSLVKIDKTVKLYMIGIGYTRISPNQFLGRLFFV